MLSAVTSRCALTYRVDYSEDIWPRFPLLNLQKNLPKNILNGIYDARKSSR